LTPASATNNTSSRDHTASGNLKNPKIISPTERNDSLSLAIFWTAMSPSLAQLIESRVDGSTGNTLQACRKCCARLNLQRQMQTHSRIYVAGHRALAGSAICPELTARGLSDILVRTHSELGRPTTVPM